MTRLHDPEAVDHLPIYREHIKATVIDRLDLLLGTRDYWIDYWIDKLNDWLESDSLASVLLGITLVLSPILVFWAVLVFMVK